MIILENESLKIAIDPDGCYVESLEFRGNEMIKKTDDGHKTHGGCAPLFPYANRIKGGKYEWLGKTYKFPTGPDGNSIHGFAKDRKWEVLDKADQMATFMLNMKEEYYPFDIDATLKIGLTEYGFFEKAIFRNNGESPAPLSPGFHPYFVTGSNWEIYLDHRPLKSLKEDQYFPSGNYSEFYRHFYRKDSHIFDDCFKYSGNIKVKGDYFAYLIETTNSDFFMVYDGKFSESRSVAVEPMASAVNSFQNGLGLKSLKPSEEMEFGFSVSIMPI
ncbi:MAG: aldose 1-epimerase [Candidatus Thermoplasmatota archaeon]|nr:aldose 1-epimerase [Candidatus Thermoplasmatota archaeon]